MSDPFIGEIRIFAGNFAPREWAFCNGQTIPISQNTALFSIVGTIYGGDGRNDFGVPNMQGRAPMGAGRGPGLTTRTEGALPGAETATLVQQNMPPHTHSVAAPVGEIGTPTAIGNIWGVSEKGDAFSTAHDVTMSSDAFATVGGNQAHNNQQPYLGVHFIIALTGLFPSRA